MPEERGLRVEGEALRLQRADVAGGQRIFPPAHKPGAAGVGALAARQLGLLAANRRLNAKDERFRRKKTVRSRVRDRRGVAAGAQLAQNKGPGQRSGAFELQRLGAPQARGAAAAQDKAGLVETAPSGAADHLQQLVRLDVVLQLVEPVARSRDEHRAQ